MKLSLTEKQFKKLISQISEIEDVMETDAVSAATPTNSTPSAPTSGGSTSYPQVGKWESGVTRGPSNQIAVTKWSDIVGSVLKRGKSNQLK